MVFSGWPYPLLEANLRGSREVQEVKEVHLRETPSTSTQLHIHISLR